MGLKNLIRSIEKFEKEISLESYNNSVGLKDKLEIEKIYKRYKYLFGRKNIEFVRQKLDKEKRRLERRKLIYLLDFLVSGNMGLRLAKIEDEASTYEANASVKFDRGMIPYRQLSLLIQNEADRSRREVLFNAGLKVKKRLTAYAEKALDIELRLINGLGFRNYIELHQFMNETNYFKLAEELRKLLADTDELYVKLLKFYLKKINVDIEDAKHYDVGYLFRGNEFDVFFSKEKLVGTLKKTLLGMGFDLEKQKNITLDVEERPKKVPRAFCSAIDTPKDVRLVVKPSGGYGDYETILHEAGHTEHHANTDARLDYLLKNFGDNTVTEGYAYLFEYLAHNKEWLLKFTNMAEKTADDFIRFGLFSKLYMFRRYCAKVIYELKFFSNDLRKLNDKFVEIKEKYVDKAEMYADILTKATRFEYYKGNYLIDMDAGFYSADYVRAWAYESALRHVLIKKFGKRWFENKKAGKFLRNLYKYGESFRVEEALKKIGFKALNFDLVEEDFEALDSKV